MVPLAESVRALVDATIRTTVDSAQVSRAKAEIDDITRRLRAQQIPGAAGVHVNREGRSWQWGNAATGERNAAAPPMQVRHDAESGVVWAELALGAACEGPPGRVHGGVLALLLDHLMGVTASTADRPTMTGTLSIRYVRATALGPIRIEGRVGRHEGLKTTVVATVCDADGLTVEAEGVFVVPRWARRHDAGAR